MRVARIVAVCLAGWIPLCGQDTNSSQPQPPAAPNPTIQSKWNLFTSETLKPLFPVAGAFNASVAQITNSDPRYGVNSAAWAARFGASNADNLTQNFFEDFLFASAFHEDTRYIPKGSEHRFWSRVGHALGSAWIVRKDAGGNTFNWANAAGSAASTATSYIYYPAASRTGDRVAIHLATNFVGPGFGNLAPEFWPDVHRWFKRHLYRFARDSRAPQR